MFWDSFFQIDPVFFVFGDDFSECLIFLPIPFSCRERNKLSSVPCSPRKCGFFCPENLEPGDLTLSCGVKSQREVGEWWKVGTAGLCFFWSQ